MHTALNFVELGNIQVGWTPTEEELEQGWFSIPFHVLADSIEDNGFRVIHAAEFKKTE